MIVASNQSYVVCNHRVSANTSITLDRTEFANVHVVGDRKSSWRFDARTESDVHVRADGNVGSDGVCSSKHLPKFLYDDSEFCFVCLSQYGRDLSVMTNGFPAQASSLSCSSLPQIPPLLEKLELRFQAVWSCYVY